MKFWLTRHVFIKQSKLSRRSMLHVCYWTPGIGQLSDCAGQLFRIFSQSSITALVDNFEIAQKHTNFTLGGCSTPLIVYNSGAKGMLVQQALELSFSSIIFLLCSHMYTEVSRWSMIYWGFTRHGYVAWNYMCSVLRLSGLRECQPRNCEKYCTL